MMDRRHFIKGAGSLLGAALASPALQAFRPMTGVLSENGNWPPDVGMNYEPMPLPWLSSHPPVVPIDVGRQLFVDPYLIAENDLDRVFHTPRKVPFNPILRPETDLEKGKYGNPGASAKDGGIWWDPQDQLFKCWYEAGWLQTMAYAVSRDGIHWERPLTDDAAGDNRLVPDIVADSSTVWLDHFTERQDERFKMFLRSPNSIPGSNRRFRTGWCLVSPDGIRWTRRVETGPCGDRSTVFYNPFRKKWVYSIRNSGNVDKVPIGRYRLYHEHDDFLEGARWNQDDLKFWCGADSLDVPDPYIGDKPQLYNLSAVAYESIMIALPQIHLGPSNKRCREAGVPKITELKMAYSRDGFHWDRRDREVFIQAERSEGHWDRGYVQSVGGLCNVVGDQLWFHYIGFSGNPSSTGSVYEYNGMHYGGATGLAVMRRDGFVSLEARGRTGTVTTCPVCFKGQYLFVNVDCPAGALRVEVLDEAGCPIEGLTAAQCRPVRTRSTLSRVHWNGSGLEGLRERPVRFRFHLTDGALYAFWVTDDPDGASHGYNAAGGPGFTGGTDTVGCKGYKTAKKYQI